MTTSEAADRAANIEARIAEAKALGNHQTVIRLKLRQTLAAGPGLTSDGRPAATTDTTERTTDR